MRTVPANYHPVHRGTELLGFAPEGSDYPVDAVILAEEAASIELADGRRAPGPANITRQGHVARIVPPTYRPVHRSGKLLGYAPAGHHYAPERVILAAEAWLLLQPTGEFVPGPAQG
jgi:hypothetical protein